MTNRIPEPPSEPAFLAWPLPSETPPDWCDDILHWWHDGRCGLCGNDRRPLVEDHDHGTGLVRGWLCRPCNSREGWAVAGEVPRIDVWRSGTTTAAALGIERMYVNAQGLVPYRWKKTPTDEEMDALSARMWAILEEAAGPNDII